MLGLSILFVALSLIALNRETDVEGIVVHKAKGFHIFAISVVTLISEALPHSWFNMRKSKL